jgi:hypothetical protein
MGFQELVSVVEEFSLKVICAERPLVPRFVMVEII